MTSEEMRIAIAELCGWTQIHNANTMAMGGIWKGYPPHEPIIGNPEPLPDYLNDLNAMHEIEKTICVVDYEKELRIVVGSNPIWFASAKQRAEAFLRAKFLRAKGLYEQHDS